MLFKSAKSLIVLLILSLTFSSCSLIKSSDVSNFKRVKYNPHLAFKKQKKIEKTTVWMDTTKLRNAGLGSKLMASKEFKLNKYPSRFIERKPISKTGNTIELVLNEKTNEGRKTKVKMNSENYEYDLASSSDNKFWWDSDIEDWPWKQIVLVVIAILIISFVVTLLVGLIGGLLSGIIGLILLLLLVYFLIGAWT